MTCRAPERKAACEAETQVLLACKPTATNDGCAQEIRSYTQCADRVLFNLMYPSGTGKDAGAAMR